MHVLLAAMAFALLRPAVPQLVEGSDPDDPVPILSGGAVPECAWPTAVILYTEQSGRCTGVYVGGRVVLTAAHCIPSEYVVHNQACTSDAECSDVSSLNGAVTLECHPAEFECRDPDPLVTNRIFHAQFVYAAPRYADLAVAGAGNQQLLGLDIKENTIVALVPSICGSASLSHSITAPYPAYLPSPLTRLVATPNPSAWGTWERLSMVGGAGLQVIR